MSSFADRLAHIHAAMRCAAQQAGRAPEAPQLIAVSKFHPAQAVAEALQAGQLVFGENRVQEALQKFPALRAEYPQLCLHLIGPLQTNKAVQAVGFFDVIQTLDRPDLALAIAKAIQKTGRAPRLYIEVNSGREPQKAGVFPEDLPTFLTTCQKTYGLTIEGLMCIPPEGQPPRPFFQGLHKLALDYGLPHISMGMSSDFEEAIACGATEVRIGTALFGARPRPEAPQD